MDLATLQAIFSVITSIIDFLMKYGPGMIADVESVIADLKLAWASATSGTPLTSAQQTQIDNALDTANNALAAAVAQAAQADIAAASSSTSA